MEQLCREVQNLKEEVMRLRKEAETAKTVMQSEDVITDPQSKEKVPKRRRTTTMEVETDLPISEGDQDYGTEQPREEHQKVILPSREEWPPAIRPAIKGKVKILRDDTSPSAVERRTAQPKGKKKALKNMSKLKDDMDTIFRRFVDSMQEKMKSMYTNFVNEVRGDTENSGSRYKAGTSTTEDGSMPARPAPTEGKKKKKKGKKDPRNPITHPTNRQTWWVRG